jgi:hypothetical protein
MPYCLVESCLATFWSVNGILLSEGDHLLINNNMQLDLVMVNATHFDHRSRVASLEPVKVEYDQRLPDKLIDY